MKRIPEHKVTEIYRDADIVTVIKDYTELKKTGSVYKGISPFQEEKTPSFCVWEASQSYKCFSSGKGGKVAQFLMDMEGYTYPQALEHLARKFNISLEYGEETPEQKQQRQLYEQYRLLNELVVHFYHEQLNKSENTYLQDRGLSEETIKAWKLGYASNHWDRFSTFALGRKVAASSLTTLGISKLNKEGKLFDRFRNRMVFPIHDMMGNAVGFGARALTKEDAEQWGKYVNSSDSLIYNKSKLLYGLHLTKTHIGKLDQAILTEGYMDTLMLYQHGIKNVVASSGTALTLEQVKLIKRFTNNVLMIYDGDKAGIKAAGRSIDLFLQEGMTVKCLLLPDGKDPDDYVKEVGEQGFREYIEKHAITWTEYLVETSALDRSDPNQVSKLVRALIKKIEKMPEQVDRAVYLDYIKQQFNINISINEKGTLTARPTHHQEAQAKDVQTNLPTAEASTQGQHAQLQLSKKRSWGEYVKLMEYLNIPLSKDFEKARDGSIIINFFEINGKHYRISGANKQKVNAARQTSSNAQINAVYLPERIRYQENWDTHILMIVQDEITAHLLTEFGIPAVGINNPLGFLSRPTQKEPHKLIKQAMRERGFTEIIYALDHRAFILPPGEGNTPYLNKDAAANAEAFVDVLCVLKETFKRTSTLFIYADLKHQATDMRRPHWIDRLFMRMREHLPWRWMGSILSQELYWPNLDVELIHSNGVDTGTPYSFREALYINEVNRFVQLHGIEKLGKAFTWGKNIYEYNPIDGSVGVQSIADDAYTVVAKFGRYFGRSRDGEQAISDFTMKYHLEIKQENSLFLIEFVPLSGASCFIVINAKDILNADAFKCRVMDIEGGKFNFWGSKNQLEQIHAMSRRGVKEAKSLDNLLGYQKKYNIYVYGNGILDATGNFHEIDSQGVVNYGERSFYIPAMSSFNEDSRDYHLEQSFLYFEPNVEFEEYATGMLNVHGYAGHLGVVYSVASFYRDIFKEEIGKFNHLSIQGPASTGKSTLFEHLTALWGKVPATNLQTKIRVAAFERKMELMTNSLLVINEFNLSNPKINQIGLPDYLKGTYDFEGGEKTINNKSRQSMPNSAFLIVGQESFWHKEALIRRCIVAQKEARTSKDFTTEETQRMDALKDLVGEGISGFNSIFFSSRKLVETELKKEVRSIQKYLKKQLKNPSIETRQLENWAMTHAPLFILMKANKVDYPLSIQQMLDYAALQIEEQAAMMINDGVLAIFFNFIESEYGPRKLLSHQDVWLFQRENQLRIKINSCYKHFLSYIRRENLGIENTSKNDMIDRMLEHPACQQKSKKELPKGIQVGYATDSTGSIVKRGESKTPVAATSGAQVITFDYSAMTDFSLPDVEWTSEDYIDERAPQLIPEYQTSDSPF